MSTIKCTTIQNLSGVEVYTAKAWVNFNGTGTVAIRASGNVTSISDNGVGDYSVNFTTAMPDTLFGWAGSTSNTAVSAITFGVQEYGTGAKTVGSLRFTVSQINTLTDTPNIHVAIFR